MATSKYISRSDLAKRWGRCSRTIRRMELDPPAGFPMPVSLGGRWSFELAAVEAFERALAGTTAKEAA